MPIVAGATVFRYLVIAEATDILLTSDAARKATAQEPPTEPQET